MRSRTHADDATRSLLGGDPGAALREPDDVADPVLRLILERTGAGTRPGAHRDDHVLCLVVEGGGMRGAVSAGMGLVLEAAGVIHAFDRIYGVSAGALNAWALAAGQAALSATHYQDAASRRVIDRTRALRGRPMIDFDLLFDELIAARKPLSFARLRAGPELRILAMSLETMALRVLGDFVDGDEVRRAVRASAALPRLGGRAPVFRGERMADGALIEPIPFETALAEGATHILVLRSRPAGFRRGRVAEVSERLAVGRGLRPRELTRARQTVYNRQADALQLASTTPEKPALLQVAVSDGTRLIGRLDGDPERVVQALRLGAVAMASTLLTEAVDLCWQPVVYRAAPTTAPAIRRAPAAWPLDAARTGAATT